MSTDEIGALIMVLMSLLCLWTGYQWGVEDEKKRKEAKNVPHPNHPPLD